MFSGQSSCALGGSLRAHNLRSAGDCTTTAHPISLSHSTAYSRPGHRRCTPRPCRTAFNEYQLCVDKRGKGDALCAQRGRDYVTVCPTKWVATWKDQIEAGTSMSVGKEVVK